MEQDQKVKEITTVSVCQYNSCREAGSEAVLETFQRADLPAEVEVVAVGCQGQCSIAPTVRVTPEEVWYYRVQPEDVERIVKEHLQGGKPVEAKLNPRIHRQYGY